MNKYQLKALSLLGVEPENIGKTISLKTGTVTKGLHIVDDAITVFDDRDINSKDYAIRLFTGSVIKVEFSFKGNWVSQSVTDVPYDNQRTAAGIEAKFNLDNKPEKIKLIIPGHICDDIVLDIKYDLITEEEYWKIQNSPEVLRNKMEVSYRTGENLVNIYWKHAKENVVALVRIDLYMGDPSSCQLMGKYKVNDEVFFKSIEGLAYGKYCFKVIQFDKDNNEIASTDFIGFVLSKPKPSNGGSSSMGGGLHGHKGIVIG